jgi:hypothetical protein
MLWRKVEPLAAQSPRFQGQEQADGRLRNRRPQDGEVAHPQYEIDHSIPLCLGGADSDANLLPEPRRSIEPTWNAERRDELVDKI